MDTRDIIIMMAEKNEINKARRKYISRAYRHDRKKEFHLAADARESYEEMKVKHKLIMGQIRPHKKELGIRMLWDDSGYCIAIKIKDYPDLIGKEAIQKEADRIQFERIILGA